MIHLRVNGCGNLPQLCLDCLIWPYCICFKPEICADGVEALLCRYDAWDRQPWISASSAGHAVYSLHFFMMMTGILSAAFLVPELQALAAQKSMVSMSIATICFVARQRLI